MNEIFKNYNIITEDFETFFNNNSNELYSKLIELNLEKDFNLKNKDTKKVLHYFLVNKTLELFKNNEYNYVLLIKPEIFNIHNQVYTVFNDKKIRMEILKFIKYMKKYFKYNFAMLTKSHSGSLNENKVSAEVLDHINLFLFHGNKRIFNVKQLTKELYKSYEKSFI